MPLPDRARAYVRAVADVSGHAAVVYLAFGPHALGATFRVLGVLGVAWAVQDLVREVGT